MPLSYQNTKVSKILLYRKTLSIYMPSKRSMHRSTKPHLSYVRLQQVTATGFVGDSITLGRLFVECEKNIKVTVALVNSLGFVVHSDESIFVPTRSNEDLGFLTDSPSITISLTLKKEVSIKQLCEGVFQEEFRIIRRTTKLLGEFASSFPAVNCGPLYSKSLKRDKIIALFILIY